MAVALNIVFSAAVCVPIFYAGRKIAGVGVGAVSGLVLGALSQRHHDSIRVDLGHVPNSAPGCAILWFTLELAESHACARLVPLRTLVGFCADDQSGASLAAAVSSGMGGYSASQRGRRILARVALALLVVLLCCMPWTVRNYFAFHRFVPLRSTFPLALWLGHNRVFDPRSPATTRVTPYEEAREYKQLGEDAFMRKKWIGSGNFIRAHPAVEVDLFEERFVAFWAGLHSPFKRFLEAESPGDRILLAGQFPCHAGHARRSVRGVDQVAALRLRAVRISTRLSLDVLRDLAVSALSPAHRSDSHAAAALALDALLHRKSASRPPAAL